MKKGATVLAICFFAALAAFFYLHSQNKKPVSYPFHYSYFTKEDFYDQAYKAIKNDQTGGNWAALVNHHLLAAPQLAQTISALATTSPVTVLLISPNHFNSGQADVLTELGDWQTPYGILETDKALAQKIISQKIAEGEENPFNQEHGVSGLTAFVKKSLPNAKIVPLIFKERLKPEAAILLAQKTAAVLPKNAVIIGSFDFSHYLTSNAADFHDDLSLNTIKSFNFSEVYNLDTDSHPGLMYFLKLLESRGLTEFNLITNTNSAHLLHQEQNILETTSYLDGYFNKGQPENFKVKSALFLPKWENLENKDLTYLERLFFGQSESYTFSHAFKPYKNLKFLNSDRQNILLMDVNVLFANCLKRDLDETDLKTPEVVICQGQVADKVVFRNGKVIIYLQDSLPKSRTVFSVGLVRLEKGLKIYLLPMNEENGQIKLLVGKQSDILLTELSKNSEGNENYKKQIKQGVISLVFKE